MNTMWRVTCDGPGCTANHSHFAANAERFARCECCQDDFCRQCAYPGTWFDAEDETGRITCVCVACATDDIYYPEHAPIIVGGFGEDTI